MNASRRPCLAVLSSATGRSLREVVLWARREMEAGASERPKPPNSESAGGLPEGPLKLLAHFCGVVKSCHIFSSPQAHVWNGTASESSKTLQLLDRSSR